jgi:hypothetical protein
MGLIQLNLTKKVLSFFLIFFLLNACAHALDFELASNYEKIKTAVFNKDPQKIFEIKSDIGIIHPLKKAKLESKEIVTLFRKVGIDERSITFLQKTWPENNSLGHFVGFLFYPHANLIETTATNFTQLPKVLKASILIAAEYGFKPARNLLVITSLGKARIKEISFSSEDELISFLSIPLSDDFVEFF